MNYFMLTLTIAFSLILSGARAQQNNAEQIKLEMKKLSYMAGRWKGEGTVRQGNTPPIRVNQEEEIQYKLDGTVLMIEGTGRKPDGDGAVVFNALAIVSFNPYTKQFALRSNTKEGNQADAYLKIIADNHFEWGFETPTKAKIKYDIVLNPQDKTWVEKGEYSPDGTTWYPFFEMKLNKVD
jgi:hypothetical protein